MVPIPNFLHFIDEAKKLLSNIKDSQSSNDNLYSHFSELACLIMKTANLLLSKKEKKEMNHLKNALENINTRAFIFESLDSVFRSQNNKRTSKRIAKIISSYGFPSTLSFSNRLKVLLFILFYKKFSDFLVPLIKKIVFKNFSHLMIVNNTFFENFLLTKKKEGSLLNLVHLKEEAIGENDVSSQVKTYIDFLSNPSIDYISIKVSAISSKIKVHSPESSIENIVSNLRKIYRAAMKEKDRPKFVNIDMESYKYFYITISAFKRLLEEEEFKSFYAGITMQSYLPNSYPILKTLIKWASLRTIKGGAPIRICLVKGSYLYKEQVIASEKGWPQAPYLDKLSTDANFKRMIDYSFDNTRLKSVHIDICSHNVFDLSYAIILMNKLNSTSNIGFQMFHGRTTHIKETIEKIIEKPIRLYTPIFSEKEFDNAIYYLHRRLEENTGSENFIKHVFNLSPGTFLWETLEEAFINSIKKIPDLSSSARRSFGKKCVTLSSSFYGAFENEAETDFTLPSKKEWQNRVFNELASATYPPLPIVIGGRELFTQEKSTSNPKYSYCLASGKEIQEAIRNAEENQTFWKEFPLEEKRKLIAKAASIYREEKTDLIKAIMIDSMKTLLNADSEVAESIDIIEYYQTRIDKISKMRDLGLNPKGTIVVISSRSFAVCSAIGGIVSALLGGNCVIFKPPSDNVLTSWHLIKVLWEAGIPKNILQFINCSDDLVQKELLSDPRISLILISGKAQTIEKLAKANPSCNIHGASEGKNTMIITSMSDKTVAIKNLINSAFAFSGQQYSCVSLAILEKEIYEDITFRKNLVDAARNLVTGPILRPETDIGPLMYSGDPIQMTNLEKNEKWLLKPKILSHNPLFISPGIKIGVTPSSSIYNSFIPGPILGIMKAKNLNHALSLANGTKYGLCASLQSLDEEEHLKWKNSIEAGNLYINYYSTKSVTRRIPFGGYKKSSFGPGYKAGGPNYMLQCMNILQVNLPKEKKTVNENVNSLTSFLGKIELSSEELDIWYASIANYSYWWEKLKTFRDPTKIIGQDNFFGYIPLKLISVRITHNCYPLDILRICAACLTCKTPFELSFSKEDEKAPEWKELSNLISVIEESEEKFVNRILEKKIEKVRLAKKASPSMKTSLNSNLCFVNDLPVLANGRIELLNYLREISICSIYHRYGSLGTREIELRKPPM